MQEDQETPIEEPTGETEEPQAQGTADNQVADSLQEGSETEDKEPVDLDELKQQLEAERKERQKIEMERNQLRNKQEEDRKKYLEEQGNYKELYEEREAELQRIKAESEAAETEKAYYDLRNSFIDDYPDERVREAAKALVQKNPNNLIWSNSAETEIDAKSDIHAQLDALKETLGVLGSQDQDEDSDVSIDGNNPYPQDQVSRSAYDKMSFQEMREVLPKSQIDK